MKYEIVEMKKKVIVGVQATTSNSSADMPQIIGGLWQDYYQKGINENINNPANAYSICLYSDYDNEDYKVTVGREVTSANNLDLAVKELPAGRYAKFEIHGNQMEAVGLAWREIWSMDLDRSYTGDYEEYLNSDCENCDINIYIALK